VRFYYSCKPILLCRHCLLNYLMYQSNPIIIKWLNINFHTGEWNTDRLKSVNRLNQTPLVVYIQSAFQYVMRYRKWWCVSLCVTSRVTSFLRLESFLLKHKEYILCMTYWVINEVCDLSNILLGMHCIWYFD